MVNDAVNKQISLALKILFAAVIIVGVILFLLFLNSTTKKEAEVKISDGAFEITGTYGKLFNFKNVTSIELKDVLPAIGRKTNGAGLGEVKKGYFEVDGMGNSLLFIIPKRMYFGEIYIWHRPSDTSQTIVI